MTDVVVTVPKAIWRDWIEEGDLAGDEWSGMTSHFFIGKREPRITPGERVYVVAHGRLRGYAPLVKVEHSCRLKPHTPCLMREGGAAALTIARPVRGFQGWRYRFWNRSDEISFPDWQTAGVLS